MCGEFTVSIYIVKTKTVNSSHLTAHGLTKDVYIFIQKFSNMVILTSPKVKIQHAIIISPENADLLVIEFEPRKFSTRSSILSDLLTLGYFEI